MSANCPKCSSEIESGTSCNQCRSECTRQLLQRANLLRSQGEYPEAEDLCVQALKDDTRNPAIHAQIGDIHRDRKQWDDAERWYRMAIDLGENPSDIRRLNQLAALKRDSHPSGSEELSLQSTLSPISNQILGTVALLGVSPRKWLRGLTVASLLFSVTTLLVLVHRKESRKNALQLTHVDGVPQAIKPVDTQKQSLEAVPKTSPSDTPNDENTNPKSAPITPPESTTGEKQKED